MEVLLNTQKWIFNLNIGVFKNIVKKMWGLSTKIFLQTLTQSFPVTHFRNVLSVRARADIFLLGLLKYVHILKRIQECNTFPRVDNGTRYRLLQFPGSL